MISSGLGGDSRSNAVSGRRRRRAQNSLEARTNRGAMSSSDGPNVHIGWLEVSWPVTRWRHRDAGPDGDGPPISARRTMGIVGERVDAAIGVELWLRYVTAVDGRFVRDGSRIVAASFDERPRTYFRNEDAT